GKTVFDYINEKAPGGLSFIARYVSNHPDPKYPDQAPLTEEEANYIFERSKHWCAVVPIYRPGKFNVTPGFAQGKINAQDAVKAAIQAGVPTMFDGDGRSLVTIYGDIEDEYEPTTDWFRGWFQGMRESKYCGEGGLYSNPNPSNFKSPYKRAL